MEHAQQYYEHLMTNASPAPNSSREVEYRLWEERWLHCTTQLGQQEVLMRVADETKNADLTVQAAWRLRSWKKLKETLAKVGFALPSFLPNPFLINLKCVCYAPSLHTHILSLSLSLSLSFPFSFLYFPDHVFVRLYSTLMALFIHFLRQCPKD